ncbi:MAG TPA: hypothetical protein VKB19_17820 [Pedobacter sp.]|nr:hypothetical protein [Pedobacter sp.]
MKRLILILKSIEQILKEEFGQNRADNLQLQPVPEEVWLTKAAVMDLLCVTESTFYRRLAECNWVRKRNGKSWYYLKSSIF